MRIKEVQRGCGLIVELMPDDCYTLAVACRESANDRSEASKGHDSAAIQAHLLDTFACLFEACALAGAAPGLLGSKEAQTYTLEGIRALWEVAS